MLQGARESVFTTKADHSFFTEPVSCLVFNAAGKTNVSILVDVHCESPGAHLTPDPLPSTAAWSQRDEPHLCVCFCVSSRSHPVGGASAENGRRRLRCHPELQMGWEPSAHTDMVQKGFKHGKRLDLKAFFFFQHTLLLLSVLFSQSTAAVITQGHEHAHKVEFLFLFLVL